MDAFVAEHVWEHLSLPDAHRATRNCERHLRPGGRLRIAVPSPAWHSASARPSMTSSDGGQACIMRGENHTPPLTHTEGPTTPDPDAVTGGSDRGRNGSTGDSFGGGRGDASGEGESRGRDATLGCEEGSRASRTVSRAGLGLPGWLSQEMLMADARDRHLVQFTPELLANVCWSAGLIPFLLEEGGADEEVVVAGEHGAAKPAAKAAGEGGDSGATLDHAAGNGNGREDQSGLQRQEAPAPPDWFPTAGEDDVDERQQNHLWGHIRRSATGGDPRGAVSIVMDCVKPTSGKSSVKDRHPESVETGHDVAGDHPARDDAGSQPSNFHGSEGLAPAESEPPSRLYPVPSQKQHSVLGHSLVHANDSQSSSVRADGNEANRRAFARAVAGITAGISHGPGAEGGDTGGVVALSKGGAAYASAAASSVDGSYDSRTGIVIRPVASGPHETNAAVVKTNGIRAGGQGHESGGVGTGVGTAMSSCKGLLCGGGGQSDDAVGSGEGG